MTGKCVFCEILAGYLPAVIVYEDEFTLAFADKNPVSKGHILVIPKTHYKDIYSLPLNVSAAVMQTTVKVAQAVKTAFHPIGINLRQNNEAAAGQDVFHFHFHVIPRYYPWDQDKDGVRRIEPVDKSKEALHAMADEVVRRLTHL